MVDLHSEAPAPRLMVEGSVIALARSRKLLQPLLPLPRHRSLTNGLALLLRLFHFRSRNESFRPEIAGASRRGQVPDHYVHRITRTKLFSGRHIKQPIGLSERRDHMRLLRSCYANLSSME